MFSIADKPIIIAFCGKSCAGKDTTARSLMKFINKSTSIEQDCSAIVSDTTRPPRLGETNGVDYNFISKEEFQDNIKSGKYLEWTTFRGWYYGTNTYSIRRDVNVGVFNPSGIRSLLKYRDDYIVVPIYLRTSLGERFLRMIKREKRIRFEHLRRLIVDHRDFQDFDVVLELFNYHYTMSISNQYKVSLIVHRLINDNLLTIGQNC